MLQANFGLDSSSSSSSSSSSNAPPDSKGPLHPHLHMLVQPRELPVMPGGR